MERIPDPQNNSESFTQSRLDSRDASSDSTDGSPSFPKHQECIYKNSNPPSTLHSQENHNIPSAEGEENPSEDSDVDQDLMANFPINPRPFLVVGLMVDHGWNRPARASVALGSELTQEHEDFAIISLNLMPQQVGELQPSLNLVCDFLEHSQRVRIIESHLTPLDWVASGSEP